MTSGPRWWESRASHSTAAKTYTCPFCHGYLPAMSPHTLLFPEGDRSRRRHAHTACVVRRREAGALPTRNEWERAHGVPGPSAWWRRLLGLS